MSKDQPSLLAHSQRKPVQGERRALDRYYTPRLVADSCVSLLDIEDGEHCLEPQAGGGSFVDALKARTRHVYANDLDPRARGLRSVPPMRRRIGDFLLWKPETVARKFDRIVGNPPYQGAEDHVAHALELVRDGGDVAFLLRLGIVASKGRYQRMYSGAMKPRAVFVLANRPSFTQGGTDKYDYAFVVWRRGWTGDTVLDWISWRK
jgi:hypothetical protein